MRNFYLFLIFILPSFGFAAPSQDAYPDVEEAQRIVGKHFISREFKCPENNSNCGEPLRKMGASMFGSDKNDSTPLFILKNGTVLGQFQPYSRWEVVDIEGDSEFEIVGVYDMCSGSPCQHVFEIPAKCVDYSSRMVPRTRDFFNVEPRQGKNGVEFVRDGVTLGRYVRSAHIQRDPRECFRLEWKIEKGK